MVERDALELRIEERGALELRAFSELVSINLMGVCLVRCAMRAATNIKTILLLLFK